MTRDWLKNNQSRAAISTSAVPLHVCAFFKLTSFFLTFDTNDVTRNLDCWRNRLRVSVHVAHYIRGRSSHERLYAHGGPKFPFFKALNLYGLATKTTWNWKNCYQDKCYSLVFRKHFFLQFFFFSLSLSLNINPFSFNQTVVLFLFSCLDSSRAAVSLIFPYTADIDFVLFLTGKIPTFFSPWYLLLVPFV